MLELTRQRVPRWLRIVAVATAVALMGLAPAAGFGGPVALAAEPSSEIPGVELPGTVVAGRLGGAIFDVVYSLNVAPGYVIVASLTGIAGSDFDLYLFDSTATTIRSTAGLLTKSTGPTSSESISWPSQFGGTYFIDLFGANDVEGDYRLTVQTIPDPTPPTVSLTLAGGRPSTNQLTVPVTLTAFDDLSGVTQMALSGDGVTFDDWRPFQATTTWTFDARDGRRTVWAKVRNGVGLVSASASAAVWIDTVPPLAIAVDPARGSSMSGLRPRFSVRFSEPMDPASWIDLGLIVQSPTGTLVTGDYAYDVSTWTGTFVPSGPLQAGASYAVAIGAVRDLAGNPIPSAGSWSVVPLSPTSLAATGPSVIQRGGSTQLVITLAGAPGPAVVEVMSAVAPGGYTPLTTLAIEGGRASIVLTPASNTTYRFRYGGAFGVAPAELDVRVLVRRSVVLAGRNSGVSSRTRVGSSVKLTAAIAPATAGVSVSFRLYRFDATRRAWVYAGSRGRNTDAAGRAIYTWVPPASGSWYWRAAVAPTIDFANNTSPVYRWSVGR